jgi:hypothetical protein
MFVLRTAGFLLFCLPSLFVLVLFCTCFGTAFALRQGTFFFSHTYPDMEKISVPVGIRTHQTVYFNLNEIK